MSLNSCDRCGKDFKFPYLLKNHKNRKFPCKITLEEEKPKKCVKIRSKNDPKTIQKRSKNDPKKITRCEDCGKCFTFKTNYYKHRAQLRCKKMKKTEKQERMAKLKNQVIIKKKECRNVIFNQTNNIQNIQNNNIINNNIISINPFGKENLESITEKEKLRILNRAFMAFPEALKKIHYDIPENRNFFNTDKKNKKYIQIFNGKNIMYEDKDKIQDDISFKIMGQLEEWFDDYQRKFNSRRKELISRMFSEFNNGELENKYENEIEKFILSYSNDVKELLQKQILEIKK